MIENQIKNYIFHSFMVFYCIQIHIIANRSKTVENKYQLLHFVSND